MVGERIVGERIYKQGNEKSMTEPCVIRSELEKSVGTHCYCYNNHKFSGLTQQRFIIL